MEQEVEHIRNHWFKDHVATVVERDGVTILQWGKPGTSFYQVQYVMVDNKLFISGDLGDAIFDLTWNATVESFEKTNLHYLMEKLSCSSRERWDFDSGLAQEQIEEYFMDWLDISHLDELEEEEAELYEDLISAADEWSTHSQFSNMGVWSVYNNNKVDWFDGETASCIADCGKEIPSVFTAYLLGLKMANEQLKNK